MEVKKKLVWIPFLCAIVLLSEGCFKSKGCTPNAPSVESPSMLAYAAANGMTVMADASGLYYQIIDPGSALMPTLNSKIVVTYTGKLLDGTVVDHQDTPNTASPFLLSGFIEGWRIGLQLIGKGGRIQMIVPSALAYGCEPYRGLPANSVLFFDVTLVDVQ